MEKITFTGDNLGEVMEFFGTEKSALIGTDTHDICGRAVVKGDSFRKLNGYIWRADEVDPVPQICETRITYTGQNTVSLIEFMDKGGQTEAIDCVKSMVFYKNGEYLLEVRIGDTVLWDGHRFDIKPGDNVNHPPHYGSGTYEVINVIEAWDLGFHLSNVLKYTARSGKKNDELEDLKKAQWYLERKIKQLESGNRYLPQ